MIDVQWWMAENLKSNRYAKDTQVSGVYAYGDNEHNVQNYVRLYTWEAVINAVGSSDSNPSGVQGVCSAGWYIPGNAL